MNSLPADAPLAEQPANIHLPLRTHQLAMIRRMEEHERACEKGFDVSGESVFSRIGMLGDNVGVGKSLMILSHIARMKDAGYVPNSYLRICGDVNTYTHSLKKITYATDVSESGCLIVVPHTLFHQWANYIKTQTTLSAVCIDRRAAVEKEGFRERLVAADVVLIGNTMYKHLSMFLDTRENSDIRFKRVFFDEADTIHITSTCQFPNARFYWFVSASWMNLLFQNRTISMYREMLFDLFGDNNAGNIYHQEVKSYFQPILATNRPYYAMRYSVVSTPFYRDALVSHKYHANLILRCSPELIATSVSLPPLHRYNVICRTPANFHAVAGVLSTEIQNYLHAGDVKSAMAALGVKEEESMTLIQAVTQNRMKELERAKKTLEFKSGLDYATPQAKQHAIEHLQEKITQLESQIEAIQTRIQNCSTDDCPICYDPPTQPTLVPCCTQIFCGSCILASILRTPTCPMCRAAINTRSLKQIVDTAPVAAHPAEPELEKKNDALLRILAENPTGRFLIFSRYENPFQQIEAIVAERNIRVKLLQGNKDVIRATLRQFEAGEITCLLLTAAYAGAGLNITSATHIILTHAMTPEEEKQIIGRAYRMGRTEPLSFYRLLHENEVSSTE